VDEKQVLKEFFFSLSDKKEILVFDRCLQ